MSDSKKSSTALFVLLLLLLSSPVSAQTGKITGTVTDAETGEPIIGANIILEGTSRGAATGLNGDFILLSVEPGTYSVKASAFGYATVTMTEVVVNIDLTTNLDFLLYPSSTQMEELLIVYKKPVVELSVSSKVERISSDALSLMGSIDVIPPPPHLHPRHNTEEYSEWIANSWLSVFDSPLSTFSVDVDNASYSIMRQSLSMSLLPPPRSVRIEEYINYFDYSYAPPKGDLPFSMTIEQSECPWNSEHGMLMIGLKGRELDKREAPPSNFVFLIDNSGSMRSPDKSPLLKAGMRLLTEELRPNDRVAIVTYAGTAGLALESTSGEHKDKIFSRINALQPGGTTAGAAGITLAYQIAKENFIEDGNNRVILATDGDFNVGVSNVNELESLIEKKRDDGVFLTVLGFGRGNIKDNKMETLADKGNGNYYYVDNLLEAQKVLVEEFTGLFTIAKDVKLQLEFNPAVVKEYRLIGYENRLLNKEDFDDDKKDAGEIGAGHTVTALYEYVPAKKGDTKFASRLRYQKQELTKEAKSAEEVLSLSIRYKRPDEDKSNKIVLQGINNYIKLSNTSNNYRFASAVAEYCLLLRDSKEKGNASFDHVLKLAEGAIENDPLGVKAEFVRLVHIAKTLVPEEEKIEKEIDD